MKTCCSFKLLDGLFLSLIFLLSYLIKTYRIESGNYVVWDEAHFGKFSASYLDRKFFFDVHPPLGKLMTAFSGYITKQDTSFKFESGDEYPSTIDYCSMRRYHAFIASFVPLFSYGSLRELGFSCFWSILFTLLYIFENGFVSISRLILLDSQLLLFTAFVLYSFIRFIMRRKIFDTFLLGTALGLVCSVKWIGVFSVAFVGFFIVHELYCSLKYEEFFSFIRKFIIRGIFLILLPLLIYIFWFIIHFIILINESNDLGQMSSLFQLGLKKNNTNDIAKFVEYGYSITIKSMKMNGGILHSHVQTYPDSIYGQVTVYHHNDENNNWAFQKVSDEKQTDFLGSNDNVVLYHHSTKKYLTVSKEGNKIYAATNEKLTSSSVWKIKIIKDIIKKENRVKTLSTTFRIYNVQHDCYLRSTKNSLPEWGFDQGEVICSEILNDESLWNIESNSKISENNEKYTQVKELRSLFLYNLIELNNAMLKVNGSFVQDIDHHRQRIVSNPYEWFILKRGLRMVSWDNNDRHKFYLFGNPIIWYLSSLSIIAAPLILLGKYVKLKRENKKIDVLKKEILQIYIAIVGWSCHYLPFFFIGRVLYFHHYLPALFFSIMAANYVLRQCKKSIYPIVTLSVISFLLYSPLTYGFKDSNLLKIIRFIPSWDY